MTRHDYIYKHQKFVSLIMEWLPVMILVGITIFAICQLIVKYLRNRKHNLYYNDAEYGLFDKFSSSVKSLLARFKQFIVTTHKTKWELLYLGLPFYGLLVFMIFYVGFAKELIKISSKWITVQFPLVVLWDLIIKTLQKNPHYWPHWIPEPTKHAVYIGYTMMIYYSFYLVIRRFKKKRYIQSVLHLAIGVIGIVTVFMMRADRYPTRWHHMTYGIIFTMPGFISTNILGCWMVGDSIGYILWPHGGNYGGDNIFVQHSTKIIIITLLCIVYEIIGRYVYDKIDQSLNSTRSDYVELDTIGNVGLDFDDINEADDLDLFCNDFI